MMVKKFNEMNENINDDNVSELNESKYTDRNIVFRLNHDYVNKRSDLEPLILKYINHKKRHGSIISIKAEFETENKIQYVIERTNETDNLVTVHKLHKLNKKVKDEFEKMITINNFNL